ncbi:MAG: hypothetical protein M1819_002451 [Sarea resinae]|nr:MAG: hypothetical protein M1819_002451 [Sarea resinae]
MASTVMRRAGIQSARPFSSSSGVGRFPSARPAIARGSPQPFRPQWLQNSFRNASTSRETATDARSVVTRLKNILFGTSIALFIGLGYYYVTDTRASIHQWLVVPALRTILPDAEDAHHISNKALKFMYSLGVNPRERGDPDAAGDLRVEVFGHTLSNPIATSAGIDKNGDIPSVLLGFGPAIVEVGGATPLPQEGNPKPRSFRLPSQNALINRYGLNSEGAENVAMRLRKRVREFAYSMGLGIDEEAEQLVLNGAAGVPPGSLTDGKLLAVQVAKNKVTPDNDIEAVKRDYVYCVDRLAKYADIIVVNVSSPNTPGLRTLQRVEPLTNILTAVVEAAQATKRKTKPPVMVKVSPDEDSDAQVAGICEAIWTSGVDGVIVGNTTKKRPDPLPRGYVLPPKEAEVLLEEGGYSGPQMFERTLALVKRYRKLLDEGPREGTAAATEDTSSPKPASTQTSSSAGEESGDSASSITEKISASIKRDEKQLKDAASEQSDMQPLLQLPERHESAISTNPSPSSFISPKPASREPKVIFASGGITNGAQALEILNAGASVAMVYTALVYGGAGTITRIKKEMREEMHKGKDEKS